MLLTEADGASCWPRFFTVSSYPVIVRIPDLCVVRMQLDYSVQQRKSQNC